MQQLGFKMADIKFLLTTQAHFDHVAGMAEIKKQTSAKMLVDEKDESVSGWRQFRLLYEAEKALCSCW